eukprot:s214_g17.t1
MGQQDAEADSLHQQQPGDFTIECGDAAAWQGQNQELILQKEWAEGDLPSAVANLPWSTWEEADILECLIYLRGSDRLKLPPQWEAVVPTVEASLESLGAPPAPKNTVTPTPVRADSQPPQVSQESQPLGVRRALFQTLAPEAEDGQKEIDLEPSLSDNDSDVLVDAGSTNHGDIDGYVSNVPSVNDTRAEKPKQGVLHLSRSAINSRMRRVMTPNSKGQFKAVFINEVEILKQEMEETEVTVEGEYVTREVMAEWGWTECLGPGSFNLEATAVGDNGHPARPANQSAEGSPGSCANGDGADGADDHDSDENEDYDAQADNLEALRKSAGLPELPDDGLPSASAQKMMKLNAPAASVEQMARSAAFEAAHHGLGAKKVDYEPAGTSNAARNAQRMVKRLGLYWKIPISEMEYKYGTQTLHLPYLSPINVCKYILDKYPEILAGGFTKDSDIVKLLSSWWDAFEDNQPTHAVFQLPKEDRSMTIPLYLYGDEGRGRRRGNTCVVCLETVFGLSTAKNARSKKNCMQCGVCNPDPRLEGKYGESNAHQCRETPLVAAATTTLKEHSFLSRIPLFLLPCSLYKEHPDLIEHMLEKISGEMRQLYFEGVQIRNKVWTFAFLGMKGDMKWLAQTGQLSRYYGKKGKKRDLAMCYECLGGRRRYPYEELGPNPKWAKTCYKVRPFPELPAIGKIPCDLDAPERMLKRDWFHCTKLGVWRHYVGSVLVTLIHWNFFVCDGESSSVDAQLVRAHGWFKLWTLTFHKTPALRSFTRRLFNWKNNRCFAWCNCKASDVTLLVEWLRDVLPTVRQNLQTLEAKEMLTVMIEVGLRHMPVSFVMSEATAAISQVKSFESPFLFLSMTHTMLARVLPVMQEENMFGSEWQLLFSEAVGNLDTLPRGVMRWNPASKGAKYPQFEALWASMKAEDVVGTAARERYKLNNFRVPIEDAEVPPITDAVFETVSIVDYSSQLFDACYAFIFAINALLQSGTELQDIKEELLLNQLKLSHSGSTFEGISGLVSFNENGDRLAAYELVNFQPSGWNVIGTFSALTGQMNIDTTPYWQFGMSALTPPPEKTNCAPGYYKDVQSQLCLSCPRGFSCSDGVPQPCSRGYFSDSTGATFCRPCANGTFAPDLGSTKCISCPPGFYGATEGLEACEKCPKGSYMPSYQALSCISCGMDMETEESGAQAVEECRCAEGSFLCNGTGCLRCPRGLWCPAGLQLPRQRPGRWTPSRWEAEQCSFQVLNCRNSLECPGASVLGSCAEGRQGVACNNCKENYFPEDDGTCTRCGPVDYLPALLCIVGCLIMVTLLVNCIKLDLNQQSLNMLTVAAVGGQMVMALQTLGSVRQMSIEWVHPVRHLIEFTKILTFDLDLIKISCLFGRDSPTLVFVGQLLLCPLGIAFFIVCWLISNCRGRSLSLDNIFNLSGILLFALFISLSLVVLDPLRCQKNPDGSRSMVSNPGILCFDSDEHTGLVILAILGILAYPVSILTWATYTTLRYPARVASGRGLQLVHRYRFLFQRFKTERYYYGALLLWRNILVAVFPVIFGFIPEIQLQFLGLLLILCGAMQIRFWPWRTDLANYIDLVITSILQTLLLGVAPMVKNDEAKSIKAMGWILAISVLSPLVVGLAAIGYSWLRHLRPEKSFGIFLCHHKGGAGSLCRLLKLVVAKHSKTEVFLDSDQLEDLDLIFDTIRVKTKSVVVVLTSDLLKRMWCAGEIVTAYKNGVRTVPLICDGYQPLKLNTKEEEIETFWTVQQKQILAYHGISMSDVHSAYLWLRDEVEPLHLARFGTPSQREQVVIEMLSRTAVGMRLFRPSVGKKSKVKARILITGSVSNAEALATLEVFQHLVMKEMQKECAVVRSAREVLAYKPWAYYFVVLFSQGILRDPAFAETLLSTYVEGEGQERQLEMVTVNADTSFEFPSPDFLTDLEENGISHEIPLSPPLSPSSSTMAPAAVQTMDLSPPRSGPNVPRPWRRRKLRRLVGASRQRAGSVESVPSLPPDLLDLAQPEPPLVSVTLGDDDEECLIREGF